METNLRRLRALLAVAEHGSVAGAARDLNISQPAVTQSVRDLEDRLGIRLFDRTRSGMCLTSYGEVLVRRARRVFSELRLAEEELAALKDGVTGRVTVGTLPYARTLLVPRAVTRLLAQRPQIEIEIIDEGYDSLAAKLWAGEVDLIVGTLRGGAPEQGLLQEVLFHDQLALMVRRGHPLTRRRRVTVKELSAAQWVLPSQDSPQHRQFVGLLERAGVFSPRNIIYSSSLAATRALLLESDRLTVASRHRLLHEEQAGLLVALPTPLRETRRRIGLTMRDDSALSPAAGLLLGFLREVAAEIDSSLSAEGR